MWEAGLRKVSNELISGQLKNIIQVSGLMIKWITGNPSMSFWTPPGASVSCHDVRCPAFRGAQNRHLLAPPVLKKAECTGLADTGAESDMPWALKELTGSRGIHSPMARQKEKCANYQYVQCPFEGLEELCGWRLLNWAWRPERISKYEEEGNRPREHSVLRP